MTGIETSAHGSGRAKRFVVILLPIALLGLAAFWLFAGGVVLVATNRSSSVITRLKVGYGPGVAVFDKLPAGSTSTKRLGRIGEGATFYVDLEQRDERFAYRTDVYFMELGFFRTAVFLDVSDGGRVTFRNGAYTTKAVALRH